MPTEDQKWQVVVGGVACHAAIEAMCTPTVLQYSLEQLLDMAARIHTDTTIHSRVEHALALAYMFGQATDVTLDEAVGMAYHAARARRDALTHYSTICYGRGPTAADVQMASHPAVQTYATQAGMELPDAARDLRWWHVEHCIRHHE